jgi:light-regulated signal transduction histidine kinase (bacteriophytochrome)
LSSRTHEVQERTQELAASNEELALINEELSESNDNLTRSNNELKQYAYVASHDLQEPLRKIRIFSDRLLSQDISEENSKAILAKIMRSAERMTLLIKNVLEFSSLIDKTGLVEEVNLNDVFHDVVGDFDLMIEEKNATIECHQLPTLECNRIQIHQLFQNLLSNSLKFVGTQPPLIKIVCHQIDLAEANDLIAKLIPGASYYQIDFSDNGIGFEIDYADQVFEIFKRLHSHELYNGSGIGLALCKKVVSNHHGHLSVKSEATKGSTFTMILPHIQSKVISN